MKYWFFDGSDVVGPFQPQELMRRAGFSASASLVCPEDFSEDEDSWRPASSFADFQPQAASGSVPPPAVSAAAAPEVVSSAEESALFDKEMDTFLKNPSILAGTAEPSPEGPGLEIPKKPAKPGPIEDYFNNINGEDLGDILGIPDPNENSDMNLPRGLDERFEQTAPPTDKAIDLVEGASEEEEASFAEESSAPVAAAPATAGGAEDISAPVKTAEPKVSDKQRPSLSAASEEKALPAQPEVSVSRHQTEKVCSVAASVPISAAAEEDPLLVLPGEKEVVSPEAEQTAPAVETPPEEPEPIPQETKPVPEETAGPEPLPEEESTCTLPLICEGEAPSSLLPSMPEEDFAAPPLPEQTEEPAATAAPPAASVSVPENGGATEVPAEDIPLQEAEELVPSAAREMAGPNEDPAVPEASEEVPAGPKDPKEETVRNILRGTLTLSDETEELKEPLKTVPVEPEVNQIKPKLNQTPEIEQFLDTQRKHIRRVQNKKAGMMFWVLAGLLAAGVIFSILRFFSAPETAPQPSAEASAPASVPVVLPPSAPVRSALEPRPAPVIPVAPPAKPSASDKALAVVQNYQLPGSKGTVASYFDRIYQNRFDQGYTGTWSAEPLHKNIYIVKYRLSKTRMEPVVYVFQADVAQGKLTGALNNAALDLVGKI